MFKDDAEGSLTKINSGDRYKNFMSYCAYDSCIYTRHRDGTLERINQTTLQAEVFFDATPSKCTNYGQAFDPTHPWRLYFSWHTNGDATFQGKAYKNAICWIDVRKLGQPDYEMHVVTRPTTRGHKDGSVEEALFNYPRQFGFDEDGNLFVADYGNHCIRMITPDGLVETVAGRPGQAGFADGSPDESMFKNPWGCTVGPEGVVYISDWGNGRIRKLVIE